MIASDSIGSLLQHAWDHRLNRRMSEVSAILSSLQADYGTWDQPIRSIRSEESLSWSCLLASVYRYELRYAEAEALLRRIGQVIQSPILDRSLFYWEWGLLYFNQCDSQRALGFFLNCARSERAYPQIRAGAWVNVLLCQENLGLPYDTTLAKVREELARLPDAAKAPLMEQLSAFELRTRFRSGDVAGMRKLTAQLAPEAQPGSRVGQFEYSLSYLSQLPYLDAISQNRSFEELTLDSDRYYRGSYTLRTLMGVAHPDDEQSARAIDVIERAYLWLWRYLTSPTPAGLLRVIDCLGALRLPSATLTFEERTLLAIVVDWLRFLRTGGDTGLERLIQATRLPESLRYPVFEIESLGVQSLLFARQRREAASSDALALLRRNPAYSATGIGHRDWIEGDPATIKNPALRKLRREILTFLRSSRGIDRKAGRVPTVDLVRGELRQPRKADVEMSRERTELIQLIRERSSVSAEEAVARVFGFARYDEHMHRARLQTLLSRTNAFLDPHARLTFRSGQIHLRGSLESIEFLDASELRWESMHEISLRRWLESFVQRAPEGAAPATPPVASQPGVAGGEHWVFSRKELEAWVGRSKATLNRYIKTWEERGWVTTEGKARATLYKVREPLMTRLKQLEN